jgi:hypothetical protein
MRDRIATDKKETVMELRKHLIVASFAAAFLAANAWAEGAPAPTIDPEVMRQIEAARGAVYARKGAALDAVMHLTPEQQTAFNPVLRAYDDELLAIGDRRIALIQEFAGYFGDQSLDDKNAKRLVRETLKIKKAQLDLLAKYFDKASKAIGVRKASEWVQVENAFLAAVETKIALSMPVLSDAMKE